MSNGLGTVHATTTQYSRDGQSKNLAIVELDEGFRMLSQLVDASPADNLIGKRVQVRFTTDDSGLTFPLFEPSAKDAQ
ncbi:Zn-ribbon domain-containing OB-fold protein [Rhodococcus koreensis]|uniref:Zn-ribbon domain-containing OB-fold protein n=1 Tax=Rhodococcus koreensis TaxID=99653 RepID=UPI00366F3E70